MVQLRKEETINIEEKKEIFTKSGTGTGKDIGGSGGDVDVSGTEGNGGTILLLVWVMQLKIKEWGKRKRKS